jgi:hypothetical protein
MLSKKNHEKIMKKIIFPVFNYFWISIIKNENCNIGVRNKQVNK